MMIASKVMGNMFEILHGVRLHLTITFHICRVIETLKITYKTQQHFKITLQGFRV
jgi:hypothetical protein